MAEDCLKLYGVLVHIGSCKYHACFPILFKSRFVMSKAQLDTIIIVQDYLTIRLRARNFYEMIVDECEARINYHLRNRERVI